MKYVESEEGYFVSSLPRTLPSLSSSYSPA
jgi:hypothetical protein